MTALGAGFRALGRNWGLVVLVLLVNLGFALVLAVPLALSLYFLETPEGNFFMFQKAAVQNAHAPWLELPFGQSTRVEWSEGQVGPPSGLSPDILGTGFAFRDFDLLLTGRLPAALFGRGRRDIRRSRTCHRRPRPTPCLWPRRLQKCYRRWQRR